jgi:steroid 5-alpha reductase family enzyme
MNTVRLILFFLIIVISYFLLTNQYPFDKGLLLIMSLLAGLWLISLAIKDASIIDIFWGTGFVILAWWYRYLMDLSDYRSLIFCIIVSIWGIRLSIHLGNRNIGKPEDYRYQEWRKQYGKNFWWVSFLRVFLLQGFLMWIIGSIMLIGQTNKSNELIWLDYLGLIVWLFGLAFEVIGDYQLLTFKRNPENIGKVLNTGLWKFTRHPNYFGDALLWWGFFLFSISASYGWLFIFSPILMTFLLMKVSGVALLEKKLVETKSQYKTYIANTPAFFPKFKI